MGCCKVGMKQESSTGIRSYTWSTNLEIHYNACIPAQIYITKIEGGRNLMSTRYRVELERSNLSLYAVNSEEKLKAASEELWLKARPEKQSFTRVIPERNWRTEKRKEVAVVKSRRIITRQKVLSVTPRNRLIKRTQYNVPLTTWMYPHTQVMQRESWECKTLFALTLS